MRVPRFALRSLLTLLLAFVGLTVLPAAAQAATTVGYQGPSYTGAKAPSSDKPESKLWLAGGIWWADLYDTTSGTWHIWRLNVATQTWINTGTVIDTRANTLADTLWDGTHLYVLSHVVTVSTNEAPVASKPNQPAKLYRYSYDPVGQTYSLDAGFPVNINNNSSESIVLDKASDGSLWATWTQVSGDATNGFTNAVYYNETSGTDNVWGTPAVLPVTGATPSPDDISSVIAFGNRIGILWSNQLDDSFYWAAHTVGTPTTTWASGVVLHAPSIADDHLNVKALKSDSAGRVFAVVKTSLNDTSTDPTQPQTEMLVYQPSTGAWSNYTISTIADCSTRPLLVLDEYNVAHVYLTEPDTGCPFSGTAGSIYEKMTSMSNPPFAPGRGTVVIRDGNSPGLNDATSLKQSQSTESAITTASGLVVLASNDSTSFYWHSYESVGAPLASFTATPTSGTAPLPVTFTDTSTGTPTSWSWSFGDGATSTSQNPTHTYTAAGTYNVTLTASNAAGSNTSTATTITVGATPSGITFRSGSSAGNATATSVVVPAPAGAQAGDFELAAVATRGAPTITPPAGWTLVRQDINATTARHAIFSHRVTATEPASYTFTLSSSQAGAAVILDYTGVSTATPIDANGGQVTTTAAKTATAPSVTTTASDQLVAFFGQPAATTITPPAALTARGTATNTAGTYKVTIEGSDTADTTPGATTPYTATTTTSTSSIGELIALEAAGTTPPPPPAPVASFTANPTSGTAPLPVTFTDTSTGTPTSWSWSFGDGATSTSQNPTHTYTAAGTYNVTLTATNAGGSNTSAVTTITVGTTPPPPPGIAFRSGSSVGNATATSVVVPAPAGAQAGDFELAAVATRGAPTITPPAGWTLVRQDINATTARHAIFSHRVTATEPASYTFTLSSSQAGAAVILDYTGVSTATPIDANGGQVTTTAAKTATAPSVTTTASDQLVAFFGQPAATTITPPAALTARGTATNTAGTYKVTIEGSDTADTTPGATTPYTATTTTSTSSIGELIALIAG